MNDHAIQTSHLTRYFGAKRVVYDLNLSVPRGSIFGFLGRNGSGKTTSLRMILGLLAPTWGSSMILGHDSQRLPPEVRARIGYLAEGHPVHGGSRRGAGLQRAAGAVLAGDVPQLHSAVRAEVCRPAAGAASDRRVDPVHPAPQSPAAYARERNPGDAGAIAPTGRAEHR